MEDLNGVIGILKLVAEGGAMVLLALVLMMVFYLILRLGPQTLEAWNKMVARLASMEAKIDSLDRSARVQHDSLITGQHDAVTVETAEATIKGKN